MKINNKAIKFMPILVTALTIFFSMCGCGKPEGNSLDLCCTNINYTGHVLNSEDWSAVAGAKVRFVDAQGDIAVQYTDSEGEYRFTVCVKGERLDGRIEVSAERYRSYVRNITLWLNVLNIEDVRLDPISDLETQPTLSLSTVTPVLTVTVSPTPIPVEHTTEMVIPVKRPELVQPEPGGSYRNPMFFAWKGTIHSGQAYQVTVYHAGSGYIKQSGLLTSSNWNVELPAEKFGEWHWSVAVVQSGQVIAVSEERMFWFTPYSSSGASISPLSP